MNNIKEIASVFFKLGCIAFGGPAAHIAMMEEEIIRKRKWMDHQHFLDLMGVTNLIPGPNSTEMTMHCGYTRGGNWGLLVAGGLFILPAVVITCIFAWLYTEYGQLPAVEPFIYGIKPAVIAIILSAAYKLSKKAMKGMEHWILGLIIVIACYFGLNEIAAIFGAAGIGLLYYFAKKGIALSFAPFMLIPLFSKISLPGLKVFLTFLKVGAILYGSGYVLFAYLDAELVQKGLLSRQELIDAVAVGQMTPGPVLSTATFIGYQLAGLKGAALATVGIFFPSFLFVRLINPLVHSMRKSDLLGTILDAVNVAAVAIIIFVCFKMAKESITDWRTTVIMVVSIAALFFTKKINSLHVVIGSSVLGYLLTLV